MPDLSAQLPKALAAQSRFVRIADSIPALIAHPDWQRPAPFVVWMHGRTAYKELDPGRYLRWLRAGIATVAVDLPGHGERADPDLQSPAATLDVVAAMVREIDQVFAATQSTPFAGLFDPASAAVGGMSAGGMSALRRLCDPHPFAAASVEATTGWLSWLYFPDQRAAAGDAAAVPARWLAVQPREKVLAVDAVEHLPGFRPIPLLILHTETDLVVPVRGMERFADLLRARYRFLNADESLIEVKTWRDTGAPEEHAGFGKFGNDAKNAQVEFLARVLGRPAANP